MQMNPYFLEEKEELLIQGCLQDDAMLSSFFKIHPHKSTGLVPVKTIQARRHFWQTSLVDYTTNTEIQIISESLPSIPEKFNPQTLQFSMNTE